MADDKLDKAKYISLGVLVGASLVSGLILPWIVYRVLYSQCELGKFRTVLGVMNAFAGGVFLCTTLLTLLPEAREAMEGVTELEYPLTELLAAGGFLLILITENIAHSMYQKQTQKTKSKPSKDANEAAPNGTANGSVENSCTSYQEGNVIVYTCSNEEVRVSGNAAPSSTVQESTGDMSEHQHVHGLKSIRDIVLMVALSIHMIFDGLGIGLLDKESKVWSVLVAVCIHRVLIFFSMGLTICSSNTTVKFIGAMVYMAVMSALGLGIGIAVSSQEGNPAVGIASAVLQGIAVGTFLHVTVCEILIPEFEHSKRRQRIPKVFAVCLGCALLAVVLYFAEKIE